MKKKVLLSIFILPIGLGTLFFYLNPAYFSQNTVNYGELIRPVIVTEKSDIEVIGDDSLEGVWTLVYVTDSCDSLCDQAIEDINTILYAIINPFLNPKINPLDVLTNM